MYDCPAADRMPLDFHIAYYLGDLAVKEPDADFYILSKDTGFDPLIEHLEGRKYKCAGYRQLEQFRSRRSQAPSFD